MTSTEVTTESEDSGPSGYAAARLRLLQEEAQSGPPRRAALARLTDDWLTGLFTTAAERAGVRGAALVAVGGYGRGELSPRSDLDLLLLHDGTADAGAVAALADGIWYPVWDLGLALDHSVRTPGEARRTAGRTSRSSSDCSTRAPSPGTSASSPACGPRSSPTGATRRRSASPHWTSSAASGPNAWASSSSSWNPT